MNVTLKNVDDLNAILTVEITQTDYTEKVEKALESYRKKATIAGFRPGKAPMGLIRRQYQKAITIDEVNTLLQDAVYNYLTEAKLDILGNPVAVEQTDIDWDKPTDFAFEFEIGLTPKIDITVPANTPLTYHSVVADTKEIEDYVNDLRQRYGKISVPEKAEATDIFYGELSQSNAKGEVVAGGLSKTASINGASIVDSKVLDTLVNLSAGESIVINLKTAFREGFNVAGLLGTTTAKLDETEGTFNFTLASISRLTPADMSQELFDRVLGPDQVSTEDEFRARLKSEMERSFVSEADADFYHAAYHWFVDNVKFELPETFLKKWLQTAGEKPLSAEEIEADFPRSKDALRWQLIENRIIKNNNLQVSQDELLDYTKGLVSNQFAQYGQQMSDEELTTFANNYLQKREQAEALNDQVFNRKMTEYFKTVFDVVYTEINIPDFVAHRQKHQH